MYVEPIHIYGEGNIVYCKECICYHYQIKPINSLYASDHQLQTLIDNLHRKILSVNMPGVIYILPKRIDEVSILNEYRMLYKTHGKKINQKLYIDFLKDLKKQLTEKIKYQYQIHVCFTDNRDPLKKKALTGWLKKSNDPLDKRTIALSEVVDEQIYKKLSADLSVTKPDSKTIQNLYDYLAIPVEGTLKDYFSTPQATDIEYQYLRLKKTAFESLFTRVLIADEFKLDKLQDGYHANIAVNEIQLYGYPVDTIIKFDLEHTQTFKSNMRGKREEIRKSAKTYWRLADRKDKDAQKAFELAKIGEDADPSIEDSKIRWQMMFRLRANTEDMLMKRSDRIQKNFEGKGIALTYAIGEQEHLAEHLFPYKNSCYHYLKLTDILYFAHFNFFGGLYIGEEDKGVILTYTRPADLPVRIDIEAPIKGQTKNASSTSIFAGETGSGKSQIANEVALLSMIFYGHRLLLIDPKGDRHKLVQLLNQYGDITSHLIIGDPKCPNGMFDAFLLHPDNPLEALAAAKNDIISLVRAINPQHVIDLMQIDEAYMRMCESLKSGKITRLTLSCLIDQMMSADPATARNLLSLKKDPMARLFYGDDDTNIDQVFKLDRPFNLVTFAKMPVYSSDTSSYAYEDDKLDHKIFSLILSKVNEITNMFLRNNKGEAKTMLFDEAKLYSTVPGGLSILVNNNLIARSELCNMLVILQNWSDLPDSIINNTGQFFIGNMKSKDEIQLILKHFDLDGNSTLSSVLQDRTKEEGVSKDKQYNFLYCDYNNRKCVTKMNILPMFNTAFRTFKDEDSSSAGRKKAAV